jgi:hypothetical protein
MVDFFSLTVRTLPDLVTYPYNLARTPEIRARTPKYNKSKEEGPELGGPALPV